MSFRNMSLKKIKRAEKKGTESVMDEKFALLFWSEFSIGNGEFHHQVNHCVCLCCFNCHCHCVLCLSLSSLLVRMGKGDLFFSSVLSQFFSKLDFFDEHTFSCFLMIYQTQVCAPSLPVVVIVHGNQEPHA